MLALPCCYRRCSKRTHWRGGPCLIPITRTHSSKCDQNEERKKRCVYIPKMQRNERKGSVNNNLLLSQRAVFRLVFSIRCSVNLFSEGECVSSCLSRGEIVQRAGCSSGPSYGSPFDVCSWISRSSLVRRNVLAPATVRVGETAR